MNDWFIEDPERMREKLDLVTVVMAVLCLPLIIGSVYIWRMGRSVIAASRFPPPGAAVVRDTKIITGSKAVFRGYVIQISALLMAIGVVAVPIVLWWVFRSLSDAV